MLGKLITSLVLYAGEIKPVNTVHRHYVAFIRKQLPEKVGWVLFNDEKVVEAVDIEEMRKFAYVYFFKRV